MRGDKKVFSFDSFGDSKQSKMLYIGFLWLMFFFFLTLINAIFRIIGKQAPFTYEWAYLLIANLYIIGSNFVKEG